MRYTFKDTMEQIIKLLIISKRKNCAKIIIKIKLMKYTLHIGVKSKRQIS